MECFSCGDVSAFRWSNPRLVSLVVDGHGGSLAGRAQMATPPYVYSTRFYITFDTKFYFACTRHLNMGQIITHIYHCFKSCRGHYHLIV